MSYQMAWYIENRVILCNISGTLTLDELKQLSSSLIADLDQAIAPAHICVDVRTLRDFPRQLIQVREVVQPVLKHPSMGWEVLIGHQNPIIRFLASVVSHMSDAKLQMVDTPEAAFAFLTTVDSSLANHN